MRDRPLGVQGLSECVAADVGIRELPEIASESHVSRLKEEEDGDAKLGYFGLWIEVWYFLRLHLWNRVRFLWYQYSSRQH